MPTSSKRVNAAKASPRCSVEVTLASVARMLGPVCVAKKPPTKPRAELAPIVLGVARMSTHLPDGRPQGWGQVELGVARMRTRLPAASPRRSNDRVRARDWVRARAKRCVRARGGGGTRARARARPRARPRVEVAHGHDAKRACRAHQQRRQPTVPIVQPLPDLSTKRGAGEAAEGEACHHERGLADLNEGV